MAALYPLDTPSRVLKRVQQMEDMELPSLPSFHHEDLDYDSMSGAESSREIQPEQRDEDGDVSHDVSHDDMATPHPLRQATGPPPSRTLTSTSTRSADSFSTASGSPFPPNHSLREGTPSPYIPGSALTSTPATRASRDGDRTGLSRSGTAGPGTTTTTRTYRHERTRSGTGSLGESTHASSRRERWQTPGEMSRSFSGDEIPPSDVAETVEGQSDGGAGDYSQEYDQSQNTPDLPELPSMAEIPEETPTSRRLSASQVQLERPRRRAFSAAPQQLEVVEEVSTPRSQDHSRSQSRSYSRSHSHSPRPSPGLAPAHAQAPGTPDALPLGGQDRIPSLSRSEITGTDYSVTSTPEGPVRRDISMMTPRADAPGEYELTGEYAYDGVSRHGEEGDEGTGSQNPTVEYNEEYEYTPAQEGDTSGEYEVRGKGQGNVFSPARTVFAATPTQSDGMSTPGTVRGPHATVVATAASTYDPTAATPTVLQDISSRQNTPFTPFTPSPAGISMLSKTSADVSNTSTPRAPLDDAQRRKSHVLAVLNSAAPPTRVMRLSQRGTPHPLRRVSTAPASESIAEEGEGSKDASMWRAAGMTTGQHSRLADLSGVGSAGGYGNESFVSVASSMDLTTDGRAHTHRADPLSRANTSLPGILLPTPNHPSTSSGSLDAPRAAAAFGSKIHRHLNEMNKQLLGTNAELAREAEGWRDEVGRLRGLLRDAGVEVDEGEEGEGWPSVPRVSPGRSASRSQDASGVLSQLSALQSFRHASPSSPAAAAAGNDSSATPTAQDLLEGLTPEVRAQVVQEMAEKLEAMGDELAGKEAEVAMLRGQLASERVINLNSPVDGSPQAGAAANVSATGNTEAALRDQLEELQYQLEEAEHERDELQQVWAARTGEHQKKFEEICKAYEGDLERLRGELEVARAGTGPEGEGKEGVLKGQVERLTAELASARAQTKTHAEEPRLLQERAQYALEEKRELQRRAAASEARVDELEALLADAEAQHPAQAASQGDAPEVESLRQELKAACEAHASAESSRGQVEEECERLRREKRELEVELDRLTEESDELAHAKAELEAELASRDADRAQREKEREEEREQEREEYERVQREVEEVHGLLLEKEEEVEVLKGRLEVAQLSRSMRSSQRSGGSSTPVGKTPGSAAAAGSPAEQAEPEQDDSFTQALQEQLDDAHREIGRLKRELSSTPHRKSSMDVRDARIAALEREKAALSDRLATAGRNGERSGSVERSGMMAAGSPFGHAAPTPFVHKTIASLRAPKTPGSLPEVSWLQSTIANANEPILQAQMEYLQQELHDANNQLDHNFSRLEETGLGAVALAEKLAEAEERIGELEDELRELGVKNRGWAGAGAANDREQEAETRLQQSMSLVHDQMDSLKANFAIERARLQRENGNLEELLSDVGAKAAKEAENLLREVERMEEKVERDVERAKGEKVKVEKERDEAWKELDALKTRTAELETKLTHERRAYQSLSERNAAALSSSTSAQLQSDLADKTATIAALEATLREAHTTADRMRESLRQRGLALEQAEAQVQKLRREREVITGEVNGFVQDMREYEHQSREFGKQLAAYKREQGEKLKGVGAASEAKVKEMEREVREAREREQRARRKVEEVEGRLEEVESWRAAHECDAGASDALVKQQAKFKTQSRDLATQIRYLKAKYIREATFRNALSLQKRFFLLVIGGKSLNEQATIKAIAQMGFPAIEDVPPSPKTKSFRSVALAVLGVIRARNAADIWRAEVERKSNAVVARSERRRKA
ncbi:hypothetical protein IAT38_003549 [Cryptococcus sp. DSM 104549]